MTIKVIGIGEEGAEGLPPLYQEWIYSSSKLAGGQRQLAFFPDYEGEKVVLEGGLKKVVDSWKEDVSNIVVLASGDPLFYGIGTYLSKKLPDVEIYPAMSSVQLAFSRINESWQDALFISVHGRSLKGLPQRINGKKKVCLLTDQENTPSAIARYLQQFNMTEYRMCVGEALGGGHEKVTWLSLEEAAHYEAHPLNVVILKAEHSQKKQSFGFPDNMFKQRKPDKGLITKKEVRVLSLSALQLQENSVVWDIGTCTGSIAIEAAHLSPEGKVYAIEKNEADLEFAKENARTMRTDIHFYHGKAPECLDEWADPDVVFIGGTGGKLRDLLHVCTGRVKEKGRIVLNAATMETLHEAMATFKELGWKVEVTMAHLARSKPILHMTRLESLNPVYIITGVKEEKEK